MSKTVEVLKVDTTFTKTPKGGYNVRNVSYMDDGKTKGMRVLDFAQKDVYLSLDGVKSGDFIDIELEKNEKDFWQFRSVSKANKPVGQGNQEGGKTANVAVGNSSRGNWETSEERAARQVMIVRQSSLSNAINYLTMVGNKKATGEEVIQAAKEFEAYVLGNASDSATVDRGDVQ